MSPPTRTLIAVDRGAEEIDVFGLLLRLWRRKLLALAFVAFTVALGVLYLNIAEYRFSAELTVTPVDQSGPKLSGGLAALGSLAGIDPGLQGGSSFALYGEAATSYPVAERLAHDPRIMHGAFRKQWDAVNRRWITPSGWSADLIASVKRIAGVPLQPWAPPGAVELRDYLQKNVTVADDKKKALLRLSFHDTDPKFSIYLLEQIAIDADDFLRAKSLRRANIYVAYLEIRLNQVQVAEYRTSLAQALISYENTRMMASSRASFAAEPFGDIWLSTRPTSPEPLIVIGASLVIGIVLWIGFVFLADAIAGKARRAIAPAADDVIVADLVVGPVAVSHPPMPAGQ